MGLPEHAIHEVFAHWAARSPDAPAVSDGADVLTYGALKRRAGQLAHALVAWGVEPRDRVGVCLPRSLDAIVALLAILEAGAAYVPLSPADPRARLASLVEDAALRIVVTGTRWADRLPAAGVRILALDAERARLDAQPVLAPAPIATPESLAYVMYTSGSTGRPKGVMVPHRAVVRLVVGADYVSLSPSDCVLGAAPLPFDACTFEIWGALLNGARLVLAPQDLLLSPPALAAQLRAEGVTVAFLTTALFNQVAAAAPDAFAGLRTLLFGGEACDPRWVREVRGAGPPARLLHVYGPTENTTYSTWHLVREVPPGAATVPIGKPIAGVEAHVLGAAGEPVPAGAEGELWLGGEGLALGYLNRPDLTAERFVVRSFAGGPARRLYRTGDRVRAGEDGALEFLGRMDAQVKLRGHRIEPGEVEAALLAQPAVLEAAVVVREDAPGDRRLVAYVATRSGEAWSAPDARRALEERLPAHMIPASIVRLDALPLSANGKVDRRALPAPGRDRPALSVAYVAPRTPVERALAGVWAAVLGVEPVGVEDPFFELGGDSLAVARVVSRARDIAGLAVSARAVFEAPTVAALAEVVEAAGGAGEGTAPPPVTKEPRTGALSFAQARLWFLHELAPSSRAYNLPLCVRLSGPLDVAALEQSLSALVARHDVLRTTFVSDGEGPVQIVGPAASEALPVVDLEHAGDREARFHALVLEEVGRPFDLARGPLLRARLVRFAPDESRLILAVHHIVFDGWSMRVLARELAALYDALAAGRPPRLPALPVQYADYAAWQRRWMAGETLAREIAFWREELAGAPPPLDLSADRPRGPAPAARGATLAFDLAEGVMAALDALARAEGATRFMVSLAAFAVLLHRRTRVEDLLVATPVAGRPRTELEGLIGFFVNTVVIRVKLDEGPSFREILRRVRERTLAAYAHQHLPFERLVEELRPARDAGDQPLVRIMFALQGPPPEVTTSSGLSLAVSELAGEDAPFDLLWQIWDRPGAPAGSVVYRTAEIDASSVAAMAGDYTRLLAAIAADPDRRLEDLVIASDAEREAEAALRRAEARILEDPAVDDCAVRVRRTDAGAEEHVAYVASADPAAIRRIAARHAVVAIPALPLTASGRVDEAALSALEVIDDDLARRWESALSALPGVAEAAAVIHPPADPLPSLHLSDLIPARSAEALPPMAPPNAAREVPAAAAALAFADGGPLEIPEGEPATLTEALIRAAEASDRGVTYVEADGVAVHQSYASLLAEARRVLGGLQRRGLSAGDRVILQIDALRDHFTTFWACVLGGVRPVTVAVAPSYEAPSGVVSKLHNTWELLGRPAILASGGVARAMAGLGALFPAMAGAAIVAIDDLRDAPPSDRVHPARPDDVVFYQLTSGSTGVPKCIQETHRGIVHHVHAARRFNGYGADDVTLNWLPVDHVVPILSCHLKDVYLGAAQIHVRTDLVLLDPLLWLDLVEAHRVTHSWSPNFGFRLVSEALARRPGRARDLSSLRFLMNAGEQVTVPVVRELLERLAPFGVAPSVMQPGFGMAEACTMVTYESRFDLARSVHWIDKSSLGGALAGAPAGDPSAIPFVDLGPPVPGVQIRIADADNRVLPEGVIGRFQIRGAVVTPGYVDNPAANREAFVGDGWLNSGDLGFMRGGRLVLTGREKETIIVRGANFYCYEIEDVVGRVPGVRPTFAAACAAPDPTRGTEGLAIFFVPEAPSLDARAEVAAAIRAEVTARLGVTPACVVPLPEKGFPKTTSGKIQRAELARALAEGRFAAILKELDLHLGNERTMPDWFFRTTWVDKAAGAPASPAPGVTLVFLDRRGLGEAVAAALRAAGRRSVTVAAGAGFAVLGADRYAIDPADPVGYRRLLDEVAAPIAAAVHLFTYGDLPAAPSSAEAFEAAFASGVYSVLGLVQALAASSGASPVRLLVASSHAQPVAASEPIACDRAAILGLVETIPHELPWIDGRHVDLTPADPEADTARILVELGVAARDREVAYRGGRRRVLRLARADLAGAAKREAPFEPGAMVLVSGGLGGVGLVVARHLVERWRARLLLVGRRALPEEGERAAALRSLVAAAEPGSVRYEAVDVCDLDGLRRVVAEAEARWGRPLRGVVHLAGVLEERALADEDLRTFAASLRPKAVGAWALGRLIEERPGGVFVGFSSVNGLLGGFSAGAYAAANRCVEHVARELDRAGHARAHAVAWSLWDEIGMSRGHAMKDLARARGYLPIGAARGLDALAAALSAPDAVLLVGLDGRSRHVLRRTGDASRRSERISVCFTTTPGGAADVDPPRVRDRFGRTSAAGIRLVARMPRGPRGEIDRSALEPAGGARRSAAAARVPPRDDVERTIAAIWQEALGVAEVGVLDNFFELGGHSLLVARVRGKLKRAFGRDVPIVELFRHPTVQALARHVRGEARPARGAPEAAAAPRTDDGSIAVVGLAGRFPGARDVDELWANLRDGVESIRRLTDDELAAAGVDPALVADPRYVRARGALDDVGMFDAPFFGMSPREAAVTDPQQRLFLECAWEALERAGCDPARHRGAIGVFAGSGAGGYLLHHVHPDRELVGLLGGAATMIGNDRDFLATRVAYKFDLRGPCVTVQAACATSLVAVHMACRSLRDRECDVALAGGVSIAFPLNAGYLFQQGGILSPDGHCRAFDAAARGTVGGDGAGVVVLKRLADALADGDHVHAVIRGSAVNNDGAAKVGYTAPSVDGQAEVVARAHAAAGVAASAIGYVEAHGTGTALGDPIEVAALTQAFRATTGERGYCAIGSVKTNLGHLNTAAGVTSLIKAVLALEHRALPPSLHCATPSPEIDFAGSPFFVNAALRPWAASGAPRIAGVSSFGFGGTNAHVVLAEAPERAPEASPRTHELLPISARTPAALEEATRRLRDRIERGPGIDLADAAFTLAVGRRAFPHRRALVWPHGDGAGARAIDGVAAGAQGAAFLFPGQGAQRAGMTRELYRAAPVFRAELDRCAEILAPYLGLDLRDEIHRERADGDDGLDRTAVAQPALFAVEYALARLWMDWGVRPAAMIGHSVGEYVAACLAGVISLEDALALVAARGLLMQALPAGAMLAVPLGEREIAPLLGGGLSLAAVNAPDACVIAGPSAEVEALERQLLRREVPARRLRTSHAFHSAMMDPARDAFLERVRRVTLRPPSIPYLSNVTGTWITAAQATDPGYWARHLRQTVRFHDGLAALAAEGHVLLEVGPGRSLSALASRVQRDPAPCVAWSLPPARAGASEIEALLGALGTLWTAGVEVDWGRVYAPERRRKVPLPTYPFERQRHWIEAPRAAPGAAVALAGDDAPAIEPIEAAIQARLAIRPLSAYPGLEAALDDLCVSYLCRYLDARGVRVARGAALPRSELKGRLGSLVKLDRLYDALIAILEEAGVVALEGDDARFLRDGADLAPPEVLRPRVEERYPGFAGLIRLLDHCATAYPDALTGRVEPIGVLYPNGSAELVASCARSTVEHRSERIYNELLCEVLPRLLRASPGHRIRILEIGGGQGVLTWPLVSALRGLDVEYRFTDLGRAFVDDARQEAARRGLAGAMTFGTFDASRDPAAQGYEEGSFDAVVGFNVVHATPDVPRTLRHLERLLRPGGALALVEIVKTRRWDTMTWGLAEGWWYYDDGIRSGSPLLRLDQWEEVIAAAGLERVAAYPRDPAARARTDHGLVLARRPQGASQGRAEMLAPPEPRRPARAASAEVRAPRPALRAPFVAPRTETERRIAEVCEELLGVDRIGAHDDFFELGADSLIMLRITDRVRQKLGREVPAHAAFRGASVERMASAIDGAAPGHRPGLRADEPRSAPDPGSAGLVVVPIQPAGTKPPIWFVHPAAGVIFPYVALARVLGPDQPFYALQATGLDGLSAPDETIAAMAERYVDAMCAVDPRGPYDLGGFSFGCLVAYEMANRLARAGKEVRLLALVDEPAPIFGHRPTPIVMGKLLATGIARSIWPHLHDYLYLRQAGGRDEPQGGAGRPRLAEIVKWRPTGDALESFLARSTMANYVTRESRLLALRQPAMTSMFRLFMIHLRETLAYTPRAYPGRVTYFRCTKLGGRNARDPSMGWRTLAAGGVDVHEVPGEHLTLLRQPHVQVLGAKLAGCLDAARRANGHRAPAHL
jgi:amino acid adenylation domain-containing protein